MNEICMTKMVWCDQHTLSVNRLSPRSCFLTAQSAEKALAGEMDRAEKLSGEWDFYYTEETPLDENAFVAQRASLPWESIRVPRSWETAGYGKPLYTDEDFPFPMTPPLVPAQNPTGVYRRLFKISQMGDSYLLRFEGVESCASVYVNGRYVGYTQGARLPGEFDITLHCHAGENELLVIVREYCDGTYLEDQDMWWMGGIIRDVYLLRRPENRIEDVAIRADYDAETGKGILKVDVKGNAEYSARLLDADGNTVLEGICGGETHTLPVTSWNAEEPYLYKLLVSTSEESAVFRVGFRRVEIKEGELLVNGRRIMLRGVNRHEFSPEYGRVTTEEITRDDLLLMKQANVNAVRTSHYPNNPFFYDLCDELGFYVIDECDLETHGFEIEEDADRLACDPEWEQAYVDRAERTYQRDKNHACVIMWSLGNESFRGDHFGAMYRYFHSVDDRPVHYEGDISYAWSDVISTMYTSVGRMFERDACEQTKPMLLCEFAHAMGNGPGSLLEYRKVIEGSEHIQGYFIWEWRNHGLLRNGQYQNGNDVGTPYGSGNFCMDGLLNSDRTPTPGFYGFAKMNEPVRLCYVKKTHTIELDSRFTFHDIQNGKLLLTLKREDAVIAADIIGGVELPASSVIRVGIKSGLTDVDTDALYTLTAEFSENGKALAHECFVLSSYRPQAPIACQKPQWQRVGNAMLIAHENVRYEVSLADGRIHHYSLNGKELMPLGPQIGFWRPHTDNDKRHRATWHALHMHAMQPVIDSVWEEDGTLHVKGQMGARARLWSSPFEIAYTPVNSGAVRVSLKGRFAGSFGRGRQDCLPRIGTDSVFAKAYDTLSYQGYGPDETYPDSKFQADYGWYSANVRSLAFDYDCPQECGNRTGCRVSALQNADGEGVAFVSLTPMDTMASLRDAADYDSCTHKDELPERDHISFRFDVKEAGLGSGSCGPDVLDAYDVLPLPYEMDFVIAPVNAGDKLIEISKKAWDELC